MSLSQPLRPSPKLIIAVIFLLNLTASYYYYSKYQEARRLTGGGSAIPTTTGPVSGDDSKLAEAARKENQDLIAKVDQLMELPEEEPTLATVVDREKLKDQPFFAKSENDDRLLIYPQARRAILYRPSSNKIINVAIINIQPESQASATESASSRTVKVTLLNGTKTTGLTRTAENKLKVFSNLEIIGREDSVTKNYSKTLVVDLTGNRGETARQIAQALAGEVGSLPKEEIKPKGDILVIAGADLVGK